MKHIFKAFFCVKAFLNRLWNCCSVTHDFKLLPRRRKKIMFIYIYFSDGRFCCFFFLYLFVCSLFSFVFPLSIHIRIRNRLCSVRIFYVQRSLQSANDRIENKMAWKESLTYIISASFSSIWTNWQRFTIVFSFSIFNRNWNWSWILHLSVVCMDAIIVYL